MSCQSCTTKGNIVMPLSATQSSHNDWPTSMFYQCPAYPAPPKVTELFLWVLLNLLTMIGQHQCFTNVLPILLHCTWQSCVTGCCSVIIFSQRSANINWLYVGRWQRGSGCLESCSGNCWPFTGKTVEIWKILSKINHLPRITQC